MEIMGSIILSIIQSILFYGKEIGVSMLLFVIIGNGIGYYILHKKNKIQNKIGMLLIIPILLLSITYFIFANKIFFITNLFVILVLNLMMYVILINKKNYLINYLYNTFRLITDIVTGYKEGIDFSKRKAKKYITENKNINKGNIKKIATSLLIVSIIVGIVLVLLISADTIFANLFSGIGDLLKNVDIGTTFSFIIRIIIIVITYFLFLNLLLKLQKKYKKEEKELKDSRKKNTFTIKLLLITLNIIYLVFCIIQVQSLFTKTNISESFDYAKYARTGFFQLMFVSFINFGLILISNRYNEKRENIIKILNLFLVLFTIIIAISSIYRMHMYEIEYGLTYLRIFVYIILVTEIITFVPVIIYIFNEKFDFIKWCFIVGVCTYCIINYMKIENIIVSKNINRNNEHPIDYDYISNIISEDSYEIIEGKLQKEDITSKEKLDILNILLKVASNTKELSWQEFNLSKYKIKKRDVDIQKLNIEIEETKKEIKEEEINEMLSKEPESYIYHEVINKNETYFVEQVNTLTRTEIWKIGKLTDGKKYSIMSTIEVTTPSKIKFFENGLGFIEKPTDIYCEKSELLITHNSGKTFEIIKFPEGVFTLSNSVGKEWKRCYDYFYLPTKEEDGTLTVLASEGYGGGYNQGKTRAKYISKDNGYTWQFVEEIWKEV